MVTKIVLTYATVRKIFSSDREKLLKFEAEGREFAKFFLTVGQNNFDNKIPFLLYVYFAMNLNFDYVKDEKS